MQAQTSSTMYAGVSTGIVIVTVLGGAFMFRRHMRMLQEKAMAKKHIEQSKLRVTSKRTRLIIDLVQAAVFVVMDIVEVGLDWYALFKMNDQPDLYLVYTGVVIFGNVVALGGILTRARFGMQLYKIHRDGVDVLTRRQRGNVAKLMSTDKENAEASNDQRFGELYRRMLVTRRRLVCVRLPTRRVCA